MSERINMKCPSCNRGFIFIGKGGYLTCSYLDCPEPDIAKKVAKLKAENAALMEYITHKPGCNVYYAFYERDAKPVCNCGFDALLTEEKPETPISDVPITP